ncbi:MAG TPA: membrane protein insertase YidC [Vicinamibacterales bacterium]
MERRVLIAVVLSFVVLYGYQALFPSPPESAQKTTQAAKTAAPPHVQISNPRTSSAPAPVPPTAPPPSPAAETTPSVSARDLTIDTPFVHAAFTTRGAVLRTWQLKKYPDADGRPLDLVATNAPPNSPLPFTLGLDDAAASATVATAPFTVVDEPQSTGVWRATFDYSDASGLHVRKTFVNDLARPYILHVSVSATRNGQPLPVTIEWGPALGSGIVVKSRSYNPPSQPIFFKDGKVARIAEAKIAQQPTAEGAFGFAGVDDHYFITALVQPPPLKLEYSAVDVTRPDIPQGVHYVSWSARFPTSEQGLTYFAGPKDFDILASNDRDLVRSLDFGIFAWLVVPLLRALKWINGYVGNFGWSLIILTILINLAMFPLRHKSVVSMRRMQEVQPEVKAINERYAHLKMSDPGQAKKNQEVMELYKSRGVNPLGGCLPMLLMLPVLYAFYALLGVAIELRGAPFIFWIHDLSQHDPYFVTPILMGVTTLIQQKMTPTTPDPTQQKMMMFMPIMLTAMFLWAASGLVLYWTVNNLWGIVQQAVTNKLIGPAQVRTVRPPAERRIKRAGASRTDEASKERR